MPELYEIPYWEQDKSLKKFIVWFQMLDGPQPFVQWAENTAAAEKPWLYDHHYLAAHMVTEPVPAAVTRLIDPEIAEHRILRQLGGRHE